MLLDAEEFHHRVVNLNILACIHDIGIVRGGVPSFVGIEQSASEEIRFRAGLVERLDKRGESPVGDEHGVHSGIFVVVSVVL